MDRETKIQSDMKEVLDYVAKHIGISNNIHEEYIHVSNERYIMTYDSRIDAYTHMSHMDATDDLCSTMDFIEEHLPKELIGKVDYINGEVGEKGYIKISVTKRW